jgi:hypothetical protein
MGSSNSLIQEHSCVHRNITAGPCDITNLMVVDMSYRVPTSLRPGLPMGIANSFIADWDAKFHYNFWRPVTAIRNGDRDSNDATERDAAWTPLNTTPMHPEYPSQAAIQCGAALAVLESVFGTRPVGVVTATDTADPRLQRQFTTIAQMGEEQTLVRIWGGIHFRNTLEVSERMGRQISEHLIGNYLTPVR